MDSIINQFKKRFVEEFGEKPRQDVISIAINESINKKMKEFADSYFSRRNLKEMIQLRDFLHAQEQKTSKTIKKRNTPSKRPSGRKDGMRTNSGATGT